ncbi:hypothetical protein EPO15_07025 [bacterium]|nr:MAG: hypothetical protein EPO15_07025 [bacterium]
MLACALVLGGAAFLLRRLGPAAGERDFFTASGALPAWAVALSFAASEASAMTVLGVPAAAFREDWRYLQFFAGSAAARVAIALWLLPTLRAGGALTAFAWLEGRFGPGTRRWAGGAFVSARFLLTAVRLMAAAAALSVVAGAPPAAWLAVLAVFAAGAAAWGGLRGAAYLGAAQTAFLIAGGAVLALYAGVVLEGGPFEALRAADTAHKLAVWRFWPEGGLLRGMFVDRAWAPAALAGGLVGSMAAFAGDQEMMQGALHAPGDAGRRGLIGSAFAALTLLVVYLGLGSALWAYYDHNTALALPDAPESILPHFAVQNAGRWASQLVAALLVAAVMDLPLVGLAAVLLDDLGLRGRFAQPEDSPVPARAAAAASAVLIALAAAAAFGRPGFSAFAARFATAAYAPVLGLVLYGRFGPRRASAGAVPALATATLFALVLLTLEARSASPKGWHWAPLLTAAAAAGLTHFLARGEAVSSHSRRA